MSLAMNIALSQPRRRNANQMSREWQERRSPPAIRYMPTDLYSLHMFNVQITYKTQ